VRFLRLAERKPGKAQDPVALLGLDLVAQARRFLVGQHAHAEDAAGGIDRHHQADLTGIAGTLNFIGHPGHLPSLLGAIDLDRLAFTIGQFKHMIERAAVVELGRQDLAQRIEPVLAGPTGDVAGRDAMRRRQQDAKAQAEKAEDDGMT